MTKARDIADFKFENITDTGTEGTRVATGTNAQRGTTQGQLRFNTDTGLAEYYTGTAFKTIDAPPTISSIDVTEVDSQAGGNQTIVITGSNFQSGATVTFVGNTGTNFNASTVTVDSDTQITAVAPKSSFLNAQEPYGVKVENATGLSVTLASQINVDTAPSFDVASGSLGTLQDLNRASSNLTAVTATDPDGDAITFTVQSGTLPTGITLNNDGTWNGTANSETSSTTYNFTIRATANSKTSDRSYTITVNAPQMTGYTSVDTSVSGYAIYSFTNTGSTNYTVNSSISADVLIVAGGGAGGESYGDNDTGAGGGGAGQVLYYSGYTLPSGSASLTVGAGGDGYTQGSNNLRGGNNGGNSVALGVTANGGGGGGSNDGGQQARAGGSAGGQGARDGNSTSRISSNKTTYSGWTSYGNSGGISANGNYSGGGGGGAGGQGGDQSGGHNDANSIGGAGGAGIDMSSIFGTAFGESGWFAGGGGGASYRGANGTIRTDAAQGGQGGGGNGNWSNDRNSGPNYQHGYSSAIHGQDGTGGGGGGAAEDSSKATNAGSTSGDGGNGIILFRIAI
jgi:hypothetical protein